MSGNQNDKEEGSPHANPPVNPTGNPSDEDNPSDEVEGEPVGNIYCIFDVEQGDTQILSEKFEFQNNIKIYIGKKWISFKRKYKFSKEDSKTVRYEIYQTEFSMKNMFEGLTKLTDVIFSPESKVNITSMESAFESSGLKNFNFSEGFDTSQMTSMKKAFAFCESLTEINLDKMDLSNVKDLSNLFQDTALTSFEPSKFEINSVETTRGMFQACQKIMRIVMPKFESDNYTDMAFMFAGNNELKYLDVSNLKTNKVTSMNGLFLGCFVLETLILGDNFDTSQVTDMTFMFAELRIIESISIESFDTSNVIKMTMMFSNCKSLTSLDVSKFNTENVEDMSYMFNGVARVKEINVGNFKTKNVKSFEGMFQGMEELTQLDLKELDTSSAESLKGMFKDCRKLEKVNLKNFDTQN